MKPILRYLAIAVLCLVALPSFAQNKPPVFTTQVQNSGVPIVTLNRYLVLNCVDGLNCAYVNGVVSISSASAGGSFFVDGTVVTSPGAVLSNSANNFGTLGGSITWSPPNGQTVNVAANPYGNPQVPAAPTVALTSSCGGRTALANGSPLSVVLYVLDRPGDIATSAVQANIPVTAANQCFTVVSPIAATLAGAYAYEVGECQGLNCTSFVLASTSTSNFFISGANGVGPFVTQATQTYGFNAGPTAPPANTNGLIVSGLSLNLGTGPFLTSVPWVTGDHPTLTGLNRNTTQITASVSLPNAIPALMEPLGQEIAGVGTIGQSLTVAYALYDTCSSSDQIVSIGPPRTFAAFVSGTQAVKLSTPVMHAEFGPWAPNTQYWGNSTAHACQGSRIAVVSSGTLYILVATSVGVSSAGANFPSGGCAGFTVGSLCTDGTETWEIRYVASAWSNNGGSGTAYAAKAMIYDNGTGTAWENITANGSGVAQACTGGTGTNPFVADSGSGQLGDVIVDAGCTWMSMGGQTTLVTPQYGVFVATGTASFANTWSKQVSGGGGCASCINTTLSPFLSLLSLNGGFKQITWNSGTSFAGFTGTLNANQTALNFTTLTAGGDGATFLPSQSAPSAISCPSTNTCPTSSAGLQPGVAFLNSANDLFLQAVPVTPNGPGTALAETAFAHGSWSNGQAIQGTFPTTGVNNAAGWIMWASNGASGAGSANNLEQVPDGINFICSAYIGSLPYGRVCAPGSTWTMTTINNNGNRVPTHNASESLIQLGGPALLPNWPGGCYGARVRGLKLELAKTLNLLEPDAWGIFNQSCEEATQDDAIVIADAGTGCEYFFGPGAQNSNLRYGHCLGQNTDYQVHRLLEDVGAFHSSSDSSYGPAQGTSVLGRAVIEVEHSLSSSLAEPMGGIVENFDAEAAIENLVVINTSITARNLIARCCQAQNRSSAIVVDLDQNVPGADITMAGGGGGSTEVLDAVLNAATGQTTNVTGPVMHYIRDSLANGQPSAGGFNLNSDIAAVQSFPGGINVGSGVCTGCSVPISSLKGSLGTNTLANGNTQQIWQDSMTTNNHVSFQMGETAGHAASGGSAGAQAKLQLSTLAGSTASALNMVNSLTGSQTFPALSYSTTTWNTSGIVSASIFHNITCTAAAALSKDFDWQVGASSVLNLTFLGANCASPELIIVGQVKAGVAGGSPAIVDVSTGFLASSMGTQSSATLLAITGMSWTLIASKNYRLDCEIPATLTSTATLAFGLVGPGTATSYNLDMYGAIGAAGAYSDQNILAQTTWVSTKTGASGALAGTAMFHVNAQIQNGISAGTLTLDTSNVAAAGTIQVLANAVCNLIQAN